MANESISNTDRLWIALHKEVLGDKYQEVEFLVKRTVPTSDYVAWNYLNMRMPYFLAHFPKYQDDLYGILEGVLNVQA